MIPSRRPLGVYVHLPWCVRKCPYCDFNSHPLRGPVPEEAYLAALLADLAAEAPRVAGRTVTSVFIGGGTPSLFSPEAVGRLLEAVADRLALAPGCEITLEANPDSAEATRFAGFRGAGVNRLSIGVQSLDDRFLRALGRVHDAAAARAAVDAARRAGFDNLNLDLMYGLPGQEVDDALADVEAALAMEPEHLSHYQLTLEPHTPFARNPPPLPDDDKTWEMQRRCRRRLARAGYRRYEISAFARPGRRCRHNLAYWRYRDYLGLGAGAHGKLAERGTVVRTVKHAHPRRYVDGALGGDATVSRREVEPGERIFEYLLNAGRLVEGFTLDAFESATGLPPVALESGLSGALARGLVRRRGRRVTPTARGLEFHNDLLLPFLPEAPPPKRSGEAALLYSSA